MDIENLTVSLGNTHLNDTPDDPECLLFDPHPSTGITQQALDNIPRFLFRIATPRSDGKTDTTWVRSDAAYMGRPSSQTDIFSDLNTQKREVVAATLNNHLRWWPQHGRDDNFVSWTSSLLFALRYIYYRYASNRDGSNLEDIKLYVVDTTLFPRGTFVRDLDLIHAFRHFDTDHHPGQNLENFRKLREVHYNGRYYFGEYLSQGSLKIADKCQVISAQALFDGNRLSRLQPYFRNIHQVPRNVDKPAWVKEVDYFREKIWRDPQPMQTLDAKEAIRAVSEITDNFSPGWRFPMAIYFAALISPGQDPDKGGTGVDDKLFVYFRSGHFSEEKRKSFLQSPSNIVDPKSMPELVRVKFMLREIRRDFRLRDALGTGEEADEIIINLRRITRFLGLFLPLLDSSKQELDRASLDALRKLPSPKPLGGGAKDRTSS